MKKQKIVNNDQYEYQKHPYEIFCLYLEQAIDYFESYEDMDFEQCTLRDQLSEILSHILEKKFFRKEKFKNRL